MKLTFPAPDAHDEPMVAVVEVDDAMMAGAMMKAHDPNLPKALNHRQVAEKLAEHHARHLDLHPGGHVEFSRVPVDHVDRYHAAGVVHQLLPIPTLNRATRPH